MKMEEVDSPSSPDLVLVHPLFPRGVHRTRWKSGDSPVVACSLYRADYVLASPKNPNLVDPDKAYSEGNEGRIALRAKVLGAQEQAGGSSPPNPWKSCELVTRASPDVPRRKKNPLLHGEPRSVHLRLRQIHRSHHGPGGRQKRGGGTRRLPAGLHGTDPPLGTPGHLRAGPVPQGLRRNPRGRNLGTARRRERRQGLPHAGVRETLGTPPCPESNGPWGGRCGWPRNSIRTSSPTWISRKRRTTSTPVSTAFPIRGNTEHPSSPQRHGRVQELPGSLRLLRSGEPFRRIRRRTPRTSRRSEENASVPLSPARGSLLRLLRHRPFNLSTATGAEIFASRVASLSPDWGEFHGGRYSSG